MLRSSKFLALLVIISLLITLSPKIYGQSNVQVAIVYSPGGLGDNSFNDAAKQGIETLQNTYGSSITVDEACSIGCNVADVTQAIFDFSSSSTNYNLIIGIGFTAFDGINTSSYKMCLFFSLFFYNNNIYIL